MRADKRILAIILLIAIGITACTGTTGGGTASDGATGSQTSTSAALAPTSLTLAYDNGDGINPYKARSEMNRALLTLLYDPLFRLDQNYRTVPAIAQAGEIVGNICTVTLASGQTFTDGSPITAADVVYSFNMAATAGSPYKNQLSSVTACRKDEASANRVIFTMVSSDVFFLNLLTFPIVKTGSGNDPSPIGSGRYIPSNQENGYLFTSNSKNSAPLGKIEKIQLISLPDEEALTYSAKTGLVSCTFSERSTGEDYQTGLSSTPIDLNCLVFLGINRTRPLLENADFRRALYLTIDRDKICERSFASKAFAAYTPFNPAVSWLPDAEFSDSRNISRAEALLDALKLDKSGNAGYRISGAKRVSFVLLVNQDNQGRVDAANKIKDQLARVGIEIIVKTVGYTEYIQLIAAGSFDLYLGEIKLPFNMDISKLLSSGGTAGLTSSADLVASYNAFRAGQKEADAFLTDFLNENPFIPLVYRNGVMAFSHGKSSYIVATACDFFYNVINS